MGAGVIHVDNVFSESKKRNPEIIKFYVYEYISPNVPKELHMVIRINGKTDDITIEGIKADRLDIYFRDKKGIRKLLTSILDTLNKKYPISDMEYLVELTTSSEIIEKIKQAWREYKSRKTGVEIEELNIPIPPKTGIFIESLIHRVDKPILIFFSMGKPIKRIIPDTPLKAQEILLSWKKEQKAAILSEHGLGDLDPENVQLYPQPIPYIYFYKAGNYVIISYTRLKQGECKLRLIPITEKEFEDIIEKLPLSDRKILFKKICKVIYESRKEIKIETEAGSDETLAISQAFRELFETSGDKIYLAETGLDKKLIDHLIGRYQDYVDTLFSLIEGDELILKFYKAMFLPWFNPLYNPHTLLATSTNAGKTFMYKVALGEEPFTRVTAVTLAGGIGPDKRPFYGILHEREYAIQIESLETKEEQALIRYTTEYMKDGKIRSGVYGKNIRAEGTAPIILTANIVRKGQAYTVQDWITKGLLDNPEAMGSRLLLFYKKTKELKIKDEKQIMEIAEILREIIRSSIIKAKLKYIWDHKIIEKWLNTPDILPVNIGETEETLSKLHQYIESLSKNHYRRLRGLALNTVLFNYIDKIYSTPYKELDELIEEILERAEEEYEFYKAELMRSIDSILEEYIVKDPTSLALRFPPLLRKLLIGINEYSKTKAILEERLSVMLDDLLVFMNNKGIAKIKMSVHRPRVLNYFQRYNTELRNLGVILAENTIVVDMNSFNQIDIEEVIKSVEGH